ncbi:DNA binding histone-like transcription factor [Klebsormidium nitens]|uniref:DNA binding histone-like transcription factor n=1 Tax=Klebsormidium nitens TaxID=105231 RepID=A0A1Y1HVW2_KLENI|nr:DNA binding histone-like transcription factor [Klebsormidium nitens]|eukprot:GAQ82755.1 DNA binding histone-like transcription factor [Klebsormidium nitens]
MDDLKLNVNINIAEPDQSARSGAGHNPPEQADDGTIREDGDAEMGDVRDEKAANDEVGEDSRDEKYDDMEEIETLKQKGMGSKDGEVVNNETGALEAEPDFEEKEKDWDAEDEEVDAYAHDEEIEADNVEEECNEEREASDGVTEAQTGAQEGDETTGEREQDGNAAGTGKGQAEAAQKAEIMLPLARIKRIVKLDPDIKQVSSDALKTIALATELFLGSLAESTAHVTRAGKRSMVKVEDLLQTIKSRRRYKECMGTDLEYLRPVDANQAARQEARQAKAKEKAARELPPGVKPITNFFKK